MNSCKSIEELLSGYLDGELTQQDRQRVELHLDDCDDCRKTYEDMAKLQNAVGKLSFGEMSSQKWSEIMNDVTARTSRGFGWLFYIVGLLIVIGYGAYEFAVDDEVPALVKTGIAGIVVGTVLLFISVLRQRMIERKTDRYKDVQI
jgi:hypothetical protein